MAITISTGSGQTTSGITRVPLVPDSGSFDCKVDGANETIYANVNGELDQENTVRLATETVSDIFRNSSAVPASGQSVEGVSFLVQVKEIWKATDDTDGSSEYLPVSAHMVVKVPKHGSITETHVAGLVERAIGAIYPDNTTSEADAVKPLLHGVTKIHG